MTCPAGGTDPADNGTNPINAATGNKFQRETDYRAPAVDGLHYERFYNSHSGRDISNELYFSQQTISGRPYRVARTSSFSFNGLMRANHGPRWRHQFDRSIEVLGTRSHLSDEWIPPNGPIGAVRVWRSDGRAFIFRPVGENWVSDPDVSMSLVQSGDHWIVTDDDDTVERFNEHGRLIESSSRDRVSHSITYHSNGLIDTIEDGFGRKLVFSYGGSGRIAAITDPAGGVIAYGYDSEGNLSSVEYPDGTQRHYTYQDTNRGPLLSQILDESGRVQGRWVYAPNGRALSSEGADGTNRVTLTYNLDGTTLVEDASGASRVYSFVRSHGVNRIQRIDGDPCATCGARAEQFTYNANGHVIRAIDANGVETRYTRDSRGLELSRTEAFGKLEATTVTTQWDPIRRVPLRITQADFERTYTYDGAGRLLTETAKDLATNETRTTTYTYTADGQMESMTGPRGDVTAYAYDTFGNLVTVTNALGHVTQFGNYDGHGNAGIITDPNGVVTTLQYDPRQRLTHRTVAGHTTQFAYDPAGRLTRVTLPTGSFVDYEYDAAGRMTAIADGAGNRIEYVLDALGNRTEERVKGPGGATVREHFQVFDKLSRVIEAQGGAGQTTTFGYDAVGNRTSVDDAFHNTTASHFDALDRVFKQVDAIGGETHFGYDDLDRLTQVVDPRGVTTGYTYNAFGDALEIASPDSGTAVYEYDAAGNRTKQTDARGIVTEYDYDLLHRLIAIRYPAHPDKDITYTWDTGPFGIGRLARIDDDTGSTEYGYDAHGHMVSRVDTVRGTTLPLFRALDAAGNLTSLMHPDGREVVYTRDNQDRVTAVTLVEPGGQEIPLATDVTWAPFGGITGLTYGNELAHSRTYDLSGRVTTIATTGVQQLTYQWDATDNITGILDGIQSARSQTFGYDALYRLTDAFGAYGSQSFQYDGVGNRTQLVNDGQMTPYTYATGSNRLTDVGSKSFSYDASGNTIDDGERQYVYDARNRMVEAGDHEYGYNALGQRVFKPRFAPEVLEPGDPPPCPKDEICEPEPCFPPDPCPQGTMSFGSGLDPIGWILFQYDDAGRLIGEYDELGNAIRQYVWLDDLPIAMITAQGVVYLHADHLNTPRVATDAHGDIAWRPILRPFGDQPITAFGELEMPLRFPGQYFDRETDLHQNWHREYAPTLGRYTQADPVGTTGGINLYMYAKGSPLFHIDSTGLTPFQCYRDALNGIGSLPRCYIEEVVEEPIRKRIEEVGQATDCRLVCTAECAGTFAIRQLGGAAGSAAASEAAGRAAAGVARTFLLRAIPVVNAASTVWEAGVAFNCVVNCY